MQASAQVGLVIGDRARPEGGLGEGGGPFLDPAAGDDLGLDDAPAGEVLDSVGLSPLLRELGVLYAPSQHPGSPGIPVTWNPP